MFKLKTPRNQHQRRLRKAPHERHEKRIVDISLSQFDRVMCHLFQKSKNDVAEKGLSKFSGNRIRIKRARAITMSMYPEKLQ